MFALMLIGGLLLAHGDSTKLAEVIMAPNATDIPRGFSYYKFREAISFGKLPLCAHQLPKGMPCVQDKETDRYISLQGFKDEKYAVSNLEGFLLMSISHVRDKGGLRWLPLRPMAKPVGMQWQVGSQDKVMEVEDRIYYASPKTVNDAHFMAIRFPKIGTLLFHKDVSERGDHFDWQMVFAPLFDIRKHQRFSGKKLKAYSLGTHQIETLEFTNIPAELIVSKIDYSSRKIAFSIQHFIDVQCGCYEIDDEEKAALIKKHGQRREHTSFEADFEEFFSDGERQLNYEGGPC